MVLHEKSLELNITHELLNLADSWYWFLTDLPLWRYWRPRYRLPFLKYPKSTTCGFHIRTEGQDDPTGENGGGFDVRIKSSIGKHLLFIQYKMGKYETTSPRKESIFNTSPSEHFNFEVNGTKTNQHFVLRNLANGAGAKIGNAVVYAFPLIRDMDELEANAGKLIRKTKFVSIADIDKQALDNGVSFMEGHSHSFRICERDMNRCEVNFFFFFFGGADRTPSIVADTIALRFEKILSHFINEVKSNYKKYSLQLNIVWRGLIHSFSQYLRYLFHYFEVNPEAISNSKLRIFWENINYQEYREYDNNERDISILNDILGSLERYHEFISSIPNRGAIESIVVPSYEPTFLVSLPGETVINFDEGKDQETIESLSYLSI